MCNVDYKIWAKILTTRLQRVITDLLGDQQTCGIRGRAIQSNIHVARSILESVSIEGSQVEVLQIDLA